MGFRPEEGRYWILLSYSEYDILYTSGIAGYLVFGGISLDRPVNGRVYREAMQFIIACP